MNILRFPVSTEDKPEKWQEATDSLLSACPLYDIENDNLFIKNHGEMVPIGGKCKQNKLTAGDNIEILTESDINPDIDERHPEVRLADNIRVKTLTVNPDPENLPDWKSTIKLGELTDGNQVFLITKATEVRDAIQGIIGGELLIKMTTENGDEKYAEYEFTISSTGSWSLWGAVEVASNVRVCKVKWKNEWYYGLKIPSGEFTNVKVTDTPDLESHTLSTRTYLQMGSLTSDYKFYVGAAMKSNIPLIPLGEPTSDGEGNYENTYSLSVKSLVDNLGWDLSDKNIQSLLWKDWYENDEIIKLKIRNFPFEDSTWNVHNTSGTIYLTRTGDRLGGTKGTTILPNQADYALRVYTNSGNYYRQTALSYDGQNHLNENNDNYIDNEASNLSITYNGWYSMTVRAFQSLLGFSFQGDWAKYAADTKYTINFRIYTKRQEKKDANGNGTGVYEAWTRLNAIQVRDTSDTSVRTARMNGNYGRAVVDFDAEESDPPFKWLGILMNIKGDGYTQEERYVDAYQTTNIEIGTFLDRETNTRNAKGEKVLIRSIEWPSTLDDTVGIAMYNRQFVVDNYTEVSGWNSNRTPFWTTAADLWYADQNEIDGTSTYSFFADFKALYDVVTGHHYTSEYFLDNFNLKEAEFWYNGWDLRDESLIPEQPNDDSQLEYQVLSRESQDDDAFTEIIYCGPGSNIPKLILAKKELGEDAPPYKFVVTGRTLSLADLKSIAAVCRHPDRQICLDLSQCTLADDAKNWNTTVWEGCSSLRKLIVPQGLEQITTGAFVWCTYMRELDLSPSKTTLKTLGFAEIGKDGWSQSIGMMTSTRVRDLIVPNSVANFTVYLVFSSNVTNMIMLHTGSDAWPNIHQRCFGGIPAGSANSTDQYTGVLPDDFHCFMSEDFYNKHPTNYTWNNSGGWWTQDFVNSIVTFNPNQAEEDEQTYWQNFNNTYHWGEDLINKIRREFGKTKDIEIIDYE